MLMKTHVLTLFCLLIFMQLSAQEITLELFSDGFNQPVDIVHAGDDRLFIVEKSGYIKIAESDGTVLDEVFLDIDAKVNSGAGERGLLGLAFDPNYTSNGRFFVHYSNSAGNTTISRFLVSSNPNVADADSEQIILTIAQPYNNHNGGDLDFGPDGYLYIGMGDGGAAGDPQNYSQNKQSLLGKMLRLDVSGDTYSIPSDNPFIDDEETLDEIWSIGLRNPWRFSFDQLTGEMYMADVGQNKWEEISVEPPNQGGNNYGWRCYEGFETFNVANCPDESTFTPPAFVYLNNEFEDGCSITGGYVYRANEIEYLVGKYIYADFCSGRIWTLHRDDCNSWRNRLVYQGSPQDYSTFGESLSGDIYIASISSGKIEKVVSACSPITSSSEVINNSCPGANNSSVSINYEAAGEQYSILWEDGNSSFDRQGLASGVYHYWLENEQGCSLADCVEIMDEMEVEICEGDVFSLTICEGENALFELENCDLPDGYQYVWYKDGSIFSDPTGSPILQINGSGLYSVLFSNGLCESSLRDVLLVDVVAVEQPLIESEADSFFVVNDVFASYQWYENGAAIPGATNASHIITQVVGSVGVDATNASGCLSFAEVFILDSENINPFATLDISPNPSSGIVNVEFNLSSSQIHVFNIELYTLDGKQLLKEEVEAAIGFKELNLSLLNPGAYQLVFKGKEWVFSKTIIKE